MAAFQAYMRRAYVDGQTNMRDRVLDIVEAAEHEAWRQGNRDSDTVHTVLTELLEKLEALDADESYEIS